MFAIRNTLFCFILGLVANSEVAYNLLEYILSCVGRFLKVDFDMFIQFVFAITSHKLLVGAPRRPTGLVGRGTGGTARRRLMGTTEH